MKSWTPARARRRRGMMLLDTMIGMMVLSIMSLAFCALMPVMARGQKMSQEVSVANLIAAREMENLRLVGYDNLNYATLRGLGLLDEWSGTGPYTFSNVAQDASRKLSAATSLKNGVGEVSISDASTVLKSVIVTVRWTSPKGTARSVSISTLVSKNYR